MRKVFITDGGRSAPLTGGLVDDSDSEMETDIENGVEQPIPAANVGPDRERRRGVAVTRKPQRDARDAFGRRPLQLASSKGNLEAVQRLLVEKVGIDDRDNAGTSALHLAAVNGHAAVVRALVDAGAICDVRSGAGEFDTPLIDAAANGHVDVVKILLDAGADPRIANAEGRIAADFVDEDHKHAPAILQLLEAKTRELRRAGAPVVNSKTHELAAPMLFPPPECSGESSSPEPTDLINFSKKKAQQALIDHASRGHMSYVGRVLQTGWQPPPMALIQAAKYGHVEMVSVLRALAPDISVDTQVDGMSALEEAVKRGHLETAELLAKEGVKRVGNLGNLVADLPETDKMRQFVERLVDEVSSAHDGKDERARRTREEKEEKAREEAKKEAKKEARERKAREEKEAREKEAERERLRERQREKEFERRERDKELERREKEKEHERQREAREKEALEREKRAPSKLDLRSIKPKKRRVEKEPSPVVDTRWAERSQELSELDKMKERKREDRMAKFLQEMRERDAKSDTKSEELGGIKTEDTRASPLEDSVKSPIPSVSPTARTAPSPTALAASPSGSAKAASPSPSAPSPSAPSPTAPSPTATPNTTPNAPAFLAQFTHGDDSPRSMSPAASPPLDDKQVSVTHLPFALRRLAVTGKAQPVLPLIVHEVAGVPQFLDIQVALARGDPKMHVEHPKLTKTAVTAEQQQFLWQFCRPWLTRGRNFKEERSAFEKLRLCWLPVDEVLSTFYPDNVPQVRINLLPLGRAPLSPVGRK